MWISRKKFQNLEKRIADLEMAVRSQRKGTTSLEDTYENVERVSAPPWIWDKCPAGHPGIPGRVYYEEDTLPLIARLSLCGMLKAAIHDELCSVYPFLIPHYKINLFSKEEELLHQIQSPALADRYVTSWERVLSILLKHQEMEDDQESLISRIPPKNDI